jgi:hypothetical protein
VILSENAARRRKRRTLFVSLISACPRLPRNMSRRPFESQRFLVSPRNTSIWPLRGFITSIGTRCQRGYDLHRSRENPGLDDAIVCVIASARCYLSRESPLNGSSLDSLAAFGRESRNLIAHPTARSLRLIDATPRARISRRNSEELKVPRQRAAADNSKTIDRVA